MFKSLRAQLLIWVILIETVILLFAGAVQYHQKRVASAIDLNKQCEMTANRLSLVLPAALYSFEDAQVARALTAEMDNHNLREILIVNKGKVSGFVRDAEWKVIAASVSAELSPDFATQLVYVSGKSKEDMGELQVFADSRFIDANLRKELNQTVLLILILDICVLLLLSLILGRKVVRPMQYIASTMQELASSRNASLRLQVAGANEIVAVEESINAMLEANQQAAMVAEKLGQGDLTVHVVPVSNEDTMGHAQKQMMSNLTELLTEISKVSAALSDGAEDVSSASDALSSQTTGEAASVQQIGSSLADIASRARSNAEKSETVRLLSREARDAATYGNQQMGQMIGSMKEISSASSQIAKVIKVIDDIAFQTNLLALNAAVEAARAGRHGKGFAVVADEVRNLAGRSARAASETSELIEGTVEKVRAGTEIAAKTNEGLQTIVQAVIKTSDLIEGIAAASKEQASGVEQISAGIVSIESSTQKNCATSEETAAAAQELSRLARRLRELLGRFKLGDSSERELTSDLSPAKVRLLTR